MINCKELAIIIPTLNCVKTLSSTLDSITPLRNQGTEIIVVDSYSTDGTLKIAQANADKVLSIPPGNMYAAINMGMRASERNWLSYINADDLLYSHTVLNAFNNCSPKIDVLYGSLDFINEEGRFLHTFYMPPPQDILRLASIVINAVPPQGAFYRRSVFETLQGFDEKYRLSADFDFFIRAKKSGFNFYHFNMPSMAAFRMHPQQYSQVQTSAHYAESKAAVKSHNLSLSKKDAILVNIKFRTRNLLNYLMRILRTKQMRGSIEIRKTMDL